MLGGLLRESGAAHRIFAQANASTSYLSAREWTRAKIGIEAQALQRARQDQVIMIHVPKCAGKAIGQMLGLETTHRPARFYRWSDPGLFDECFTFGFTRNPFDRVVSAYHFLKQSTGPQGSAFQGRFLTEDTGFSSFVRRLAKPRFAADVMTSIHFIPQTYFLCDSSGRVMVDQICYFESIDQELKALGKRLGLDVTMITANASRREPVSNYYDEEAKDIVSELYAADFAVFGYDPKRVS